MTEKRNQWVVLAVGLLILSAIVCYQAFDSKPLFAEEMVAESTSVVSTTKNTTTVSNEKTSTIPDNSKNSQNIVINLNLATLAELCTVSGIGEAKGKAIIDYRQSVGEFSSVDELINVKGIGEATFNKIKGAFIV